MDFLITSQLNKIQTTLVTGSTKVSQLLQSLREEDGQMPSLKAAKFTLKESSHVCWVPPTNPHQVIQQVKSVLLWETGNEGRSSSERTEFCAR